MMKFGYSESEMTMIKMNYQ